MTSTAQPEQPEHYTGVTPSAFTESLSGWEEIAIKREFGKDVGDLPGSMTLRALYFVAVRRGGVDAPLAYKAAMGARLGDVYGIFAKDEPEPEAPADAVERYGDLDDVDPDNPLQALTGDASGGV